jgi:hypothetical protein
MAEAPNIPRYSEAKGENGPYKSSKLEGIIKNADYLVPGVTKSSYERAGIEIVNGVPVEINKSDFDAFVKAGLVDPSEYTLRFTGRYIKTKFVPGQQPLTYTKRDFIISDKIAARETAEGAEIFITAITAPGLVRGTAGLVGCGVKAAATGVTRVAATKELAEQFAKLGLPRSKQTVVLMETAEGRTIIAAGGGKLTQAQLALAREKGLLIAEDMAGFHAEISGVYTAGQNGLLPTRGVVTNQMCKYGADNCYSQLSEMAAKGGYELRLLDNGRAFEFVKKVGGK